jgi:hypothetical protein
MSGPAVVAPDSHPKPLYPAGDGGQSKTAADKHDTRGCCWTLKQAMKPANVNAWAEGPFFWKDLCFLWQAMCCGPCCGWPILGCYAYTVGRVARNMEQLTDQAEQRKQAKLAAMV